MELIKGNYSKLVFGPIRDASKAIITNLPSAIAVRYAIKHNPTDLDADAEVMKTLSVGITVDDPIQGCISVIILPADTEDLEEKLYYHGLQIEYSATNVQEIRMKEHGKVINTFDLIQDIVRKP